MELDDGRWQQADAVEVRFRGTRKGNQEQIRSERRVDTRRGSRIEVVR